MTRKKAWAKTRQVVIVNELGLHARSAAGIARLAKAARRGVWILKNGHAADARSMLDVLSLVCPKGTRIAVGIDDLSDEKIMDEIVLLVENGFGE